MKMIAILALMTVALAAQSPRPWMQGTVEKYCHTTQGHVDRMRKEFPDKAENIRLCACKHSCDKSYEHAKETGGRKWDAACQARCHPDNCNCPDPCST